MFLSIEKFFGLKVNGYHRLLKVDIIYSRPREGRVGILLAMFFKVDVCVKFEPKLFLKEISTAASVEGQICN